MNRPPDYDISEFFLGLTVYVVLALSLLFAFSDAFSAVTTASHRSYALRPCSTCREIVFATESECVEAGEAEALRAGATREIGRAVYTCIIRHNIIATFRPNANGTATLLWTHDGANITGFRVVYGLRPQELTSSVELTNPSLRSHTLTALPAVMHYFAVIAVNDGTDSILSNITAKAVL